jgi:hypothetical protein
MLHRLQAPTIGNLSVATPQASNLPEYRSRAGNFEKKWRIFPRFWDGEDSFMQLAIDSPRPRAYLGRTPK